MPRSLPSYAITEKNKIAAVGAFLNLVQLDISGESPLRFALSQSDVVWGGNTYSAMPMQIGDINESLQGRVETSILKISNVNRTLEPFLQNHDGAAGAIITITVVHSEHLGESVPVTEDLYDIVETQADEQWVTFTVGGVSPFKRRFPRDRYISTVCRHFFTGPLCLYAGADPTCDHSLPDCQSKSNEAQYGGSPGISEGVYG